jgi:hypothetical protein
MRTSAVLDKLGALGTLLAAAACPACFPLLAVVGSALGLGIFARFEGYVMYVLQAFVLLALVGNVLAYRGHRKIALLIAGVGSPLVVFYAIHVSFSPLLMYVGLAGLSVTAVGNYLAGRRCAKCDTVILNSVITCPKCGHRQPETMPTDACQHFYECLRCRALLKPKPGDCCVFCSYGTVKCPPMQKGAQCQTC